MLPKVFGGRCSLALGILVVFFTTTNGFLLFAAGPKHKVAGSNSRVRRDSGRADVVRFHVLSKVTSRYSQVLVTSVVQNRGNAAREVTVDMKLPKAAFISNFSMEIEGRTYVGIVKEKEAAQAEYQHAISTGQSAGLVKTKIRGTQTFDVSVNVEPYSQVTFRLNYEELLERKLGVYNHVIYADPGQTVEDFEIKVHINEQVGISLLEATTPNAHGKRPDSPFDVGNSQDGKIRRTETQGFVTYKPTVIQQEQFRRGDHAFTVTYDVKRETLGGSILIRNGYFVHFFAPEGMPVIPKDIVFVIDESGSMSGSKMSHTKEAFTTILDDLKLHDRFNVITFSGTVQTWTNNEMMQVSPSSISEAKDFVSRIRAGGSTNFYDAMMSGIGLLETTASSRNTFERAGMVIVLTDGRPTTGITNSAEIQRRVKETVRGRYSVFCLGFGADLDHDFLNKLSNENQGISRRIYNDADAVIQLKGFYDEVASPMLAHVIMNYTGTDVAELSSTRFDNFFDGSEIMVVGRLMSPPTIRSSSEDLLPEPIPDMKCVIGGISADGDVTLVGRGVILGNSFVDPGFDMEKIWAYRTIKELLKNKTYVDGDDQEAIREIDDEVIRLSLKFNFVTDRTAMVVTKPGQEEGTLAGDGEQTPPPRPLPRVQNSPIAQQRISSARLSSNGRVGYGFPMSYNVPSYSGGLQYGRVAHHAAALPNFRSGRAWPYISSPRRRQFSVVQQPAWKHHQQLPRKRLSLLHLFTTTTTPAPTTTTTTEAQTTTPTPTVPAPPPPTDPLALTATCGEFMNVGVGEPANFTTPSYPDLYPSSSQCVWRFEKDSSSENPMVLKLTFPKMDLEESANCAYDRVLVYPDFDDNIPAPEVLSYCGFKSEPVTLTARQRMIVVFQSDDMVNGRGFVASVHLEEMAL